MAPTLAELVVEERMLAPERVAAARARAREQGAALVAAIVDEGVPDAALAVMLARRVRVPVAALEAVDNDALREVAHETARRRRVLPLSIEMLADGSRVLHMAVADPTDREALLEVEHASGCRVAMAVAPLGALDEATERAYRGFVTQVMPRAAGAEAPRTPFGGDLAVMTPRHGMAGDKHGPSTQPFHRVEDEASLELRVRALGELLVAKGVITVEEWSAVIRKLMRGGE